jgi:hypothetical protein
MALGAVILVAAGNLTWRWFSKGRYPSLWSVGLIMAGCILSGVSGLLDGYPWLAVACWVFVLPGFPIMVAAARGRRREAGNA